ncbi:hypothetical protein HYC85_019651 [Camellia sinensis]|uniref:Uncharacterized protein n=1 Tax=Camellia sinensis TaxID=4442 RepID=A0A7J7GMI9_CAMSI|nr:hypothetical protein HYC85_019651 [Camellia sinensis]
MGGFECGLLGECVGQSWYRITVNGSSFVCKYGLKAHSILFAGVILLIREYRLKGRFSVTALVKSLMKRSDRSIICLKLPGCCSEEALFYAADDPVEMYALLSWTGLVLRISGSTRQKLDRDCGARLSPRSRITDETRQGTRS